MRASVQALRLGTRGSLLAVAQSRLVARALMQRHPGLRVRLVTLETRGDRNQVTPLSSVGDGSFFSAELDAALTGGDVDFCVHSLKDLDHERPASVVRAAVGQREDPRDVVVFRSDIIDRLRQGRAIRIGSSSARRTFNTERFLRDALPCFGAAPSIVFSPLRGAVDRRLARIRAHHEATEALDGVVLAFAGLVRLWGDADGRSAIKPLLSQARWMVLPLSECPSAPGQGALAIECRSADAATRELLNGLHDPVSAALVRHEQDAVADFPAALRPAIGATAIANKTIGPLLYVRGDDAGEPAVRWPHPPRPQRSNAWDAGELRRVLRPHSLPADESITRARALFVAHWHAVTESVRLADDARVWVSGVRSWRELARKGLWIEGCADNLGFADLQPTLGCDVLQLPTLSEWLVLTHDRAIAGWLGSGVRRVEATYSMNPLDAPGDLAQLQQRLARATHIFWGSVEQYRKVASWVPAAAHHACGSGKTAQSLRAAGLEAVQPFPSRKEWQAWVR